VLGARSQARLLLDQVEAVGKGAAEATRRRQWVAQESWENAERTEGSYAWIETGKASAAEARGYLPSIK